MNLVVLLKNILKSIENILYDNILLFIPISVVILGFYFLPSYEKLLRYKYNAGYSEEESIQAAKDEALQSFSWVSISVVVVCGIIYIYTQYQDHNIRRRDTRRIYPI